MALQRSFSRQVRAAVPLGLAIGITLLHARPLVAQQPRPDGVDDVLLLAVHGPDARRFVVVGGNAETDPAVLLRTEDGGATFRPAEVPAVRHRLYDVHFVDARLAYACGLGSTLLRSEDGGARWRQLPAPIDGAWFTAVHFVDREHGVLVGAHDGALVLVTDDGARTWRRLPLPGDAGAATNNLRDVLMLDRHTGFACGDGGLLLRTIDGGAHWQRLESHSTSWLRHLSFPDRQHGFVVAANGELLATEDGGEHWQPRGRVSGKANSVAFLDGAHGYVVTMDGDLQRTHDGGRTFARELHLDGHICDVAVLDDQVICVGDNGLVHRVASAAGTAGR